MYIFHYFQYIQTRKGHFIDIETGRVVGDHSGIHKWTVGQRCCLKDWKDAYFVFKKDLDTNNLYVVGYSTIFHEIPNIPGRSLGYWDNLWDYLGFKNFIFISCRSLVLNILLCGTTFVLQKLLTGYVKDQLN